MSHLSLRLALCSLFVLFGADLVGSVDSSKTAKRTPEEITLLVSTDRGVSGGVYLGFHGECKALVALHAVENVRESKLKRGFQTATGTLEWPQKPTKQQKIDDLAVLNLSWKIGDCMQFEELVEDPDVFYRNVAEAFGYLNENAVGKIQRHFVAERRHRAGIRYWYFPELFNRGSSGSPLLVDGRMIGVVWGNLTDDDQGASTRYGAAMTNSTIRERLRDYLNQRIALNSTR